jgi:bacterioferritin-associated ferredoxin
MIICSCNVLSDHDVRNAVTAGTAVPRTAGQVYGCLGCSAQCGRCARTIKQIMTEALGPCAKACCDGCPHSNHQDTAAQHQHGHRHETPTVPVNLDMQIAAA